MSFYVRQGERGTLIPLGDFTGGEASAFPLTNMPSKYSMLMQNCHVSERGGVAKIPGYVKVNTNNVGVDLVSGFEFTKANGATVKLCAGGGKIFKVNGVSLDQVHTGLDAAAKVHFTQANDMVVATNGVNAPHKSADGTTWAALGQAPAKGLISRMHQGRMWMNRTDDTMRADYSALRAIEDWTTAGNAGNYDYKFILSKGDRLIDFASYKGLLVNLFRRHIAIYAGSNPTDSGNFALQDIIGETGVMATGAALNVDNDLVYVYDSGIKRLRQAVINGPINADNLSALIDPTLIPLLANLTTAATAHYAARKWLLFLINGTVWVYSYFWKAWSRIVGADVKGMFTDAAGKLYFTGSGFLYEFDSGHTFAGTLPEMLWQTAWLSFSKQRINAYPKLAEIVTYPLAPTTLEFQAAYDLQPAMPETSTALGIGPQNVTEIDAATDFDAINPLDETPFYAPRIPLFGGGDLMSMTVGNTSNVPVEISDIILQAARGGF